MNVILKNLYQGENSVKMMIRNGEKIYQQLTKFVFDVDKDSIEFPASGGTDTLTITANENWTITVPSWVSASAVSGRSSATITLTTQATQETLEGDIVITCNGVQKTVSVTAGIHDYSKDYLTIEALSGGTFYVKKANIGYSVNGADWETTTGETPLSLNLGDKVRFKGTGGGKGVFSNNTMSFMIYGNIESLEYGDDFTGATEVKNISGFSGCFSACSGMVDASNLMLPATSLTDYCYNDMFLHCVSLRTLPELPATTLSLSCYMAMFYGCTSLTIAPALPATTLAERCYNDMFQECTSLTTVPELPATTLDRWCYGGMFYNCTNLNHIKCLATDISAGYCLRDWLGGVSSTGTFVKAAGVNWPTGASGIPSGWTVIEE